jgi:DNA modification methylase
MQLTLFDLEKTTIEDISNPRTYKDICSFHKYWGKKPTESITYFIQNYTNETDIVLDPFLGSGMISRECLQYNRRFIGIDLNPFAVEHTNFLIEPPTARDFLKAFKEIERNIKKTINDTYLTENAKIGSHYLWNQEKLIKVWVKPETGRNRIELEPTDFDINQISLFSDYKVKNIRKTTFFNNSRINASEYMSIYDLFTRRALHNIDIILEEIYKYPEILRRALLLTLTSSSGQMSSMVFAITGRGKTKNKVSEKIEVGSWVIGFWRPTLHFEINVWNCFERRANKLFNALCKCNNKKHKRYNTIVENIKSNHGATILNGDCLKILQTIPDKSIKLICTDPPHSDRIPYLELSEMWNSILNKNIDFESEIIVSNAKERNKTNSQYNEKMEILISEAGRILKNDGLLLIYFNARDKKSWKFFDILDADNQLSFVGAFPMEYSASSVVQDNRKGGMKTDYVLVIKNKNSIKPFKHELNKIPGWIDTFPKIGI